MSLRFLLGPAGSGKTRRCFDEIVAALREDPRDGPPLYFLVPEQATFQTERALLERDERVAAVSRARAVSFKRLAYLALEREGPLSRPFIGEQGRLLALMVAVKREQGELEAYGRTAETEGFVERLALTLQELKAYRRDADSLAGARERLAASGDPGADLLAAKLADLERIYRRYEALISGKFRDGEDALALAARAIREGGFAAGAHVWVDGFAGFTPQEYELLGSLLAKAHRVTVALCLDPSRGPSSVWAWDEGPADGLFHLTRETLVLLRELAVENGVVVEEPVLLGRAPHDVEPRFVAAPLLGRMEKALVESEGALYPVSPAGEGPLAPGGRNEGPPAADGRDEMSPAAQGRPGGSGKPGEPGGPPACSVLEAPDRAGEVEAAAKTIARLVREKGYRYSDIAVVVRSLDPYHTLVENVFRAWDIPFFIDQKAPAIHHPLVLFVEAALDVLAAGIDTPALVRWLKTDLAPLTRDEVDRLEIRAIELGARGADWLDGSLWGDLDGLRRRAVGPLRRFLAGASSAADFGEGDPAAGLAGEDRAREPRAGEGDGRKPASAYARALYELLESAGVPGKLEAWAEEAEREGRRTEASDHRLVWQGLCELLDEIAGVMGDAALSAREFVAACELGLKRLRLGRVPAHADEVLVGSVDRSRQPELRCVILLGWNEGVFPLEPAEDPILSDLDRERLRALGLALGPASTERLFHERYLIYIALTRASERLVLVFSRSDDTGRPLRASPVISWLLAAFPDVGVESLPAYASPLELPERPGALRGWIARGLRAGREGDPAFRAAERRLRTALRFVRERLDGGVAGGAEDPGGDRANCPGFVGPGREGGSGRGGQALAGRAAAAIDPFAALEFANTSPRIPGELVRFIYETDPEGRLVVSPSGLEDAAACPFRFFAAHGLRLRERREPKVDAALLGSLGHAVLRDVVSRLAESGKDLSECTHDECDALVASSFARIVASGEYLALRRSSASRYAGMRLERALRAVARAIVDAARAGAFRPAELEAPFGPGESLPALLLGESAVVRGRIDRIDLAESGGQTYVRVVDYKSSAKAMRLSEVYYGLDLQLCIYLAVASSAGRGYRPAGCLYSPIVDPIATVSRPEDEREAWRKALKARGLVVDDGVAPRLMDERSSGQSPFLQLFFKQDGTLGAASDAASPEKVRALVRHALAIAAGLVRAAAGGDTSIAPFEHGGERACTYCPYKPVCQFDVTAPPMGYRKLRVLRDEEVWERIDEESTEEGLTAGDRIEGDDARAS